MEHKVLITGASGGLGGGMLDTLLELLPADRLVALARTAEKVERFARKGVEIRLADFDDAEALERALTGIHTLVLVPTTAPHRMVQHRRVVDIATAKGVQHILYTGVIHHDEPGHSAVIRDHQDTEAYIVASGVPHTFVRNSIYLDVLPMMLGGAAVTGEFAYPAAPKGVSLATRADMAEATARIIADPTLQGRTFALSSPRPIHYSEVAEAYAAIIGRSVHHVDIALPDYQALLVRNGVPEHFAPFLTDMARALSEGVIRQPSDQLAELLGRTPTDVSTALRTLMQQASA
jgi:NAD(P)H dehydrogenase (quinone)